MKFDMEEDINIDLTPLIDVVFMLLIFFIMTTTFSKPVLDIVLPSSDTSARQDNKRKELLITVDSSGGIFYGSNKLDAAGLTELLRTEGDTLLNLNIDEKAPFETFVQLVDIAKKERGGEFVITTEHK